MSQNVESTRGGGALVAISRHGAMLARRVADAEVVDSDAKLWVTARWLNPENPREQPFDVPARTLISDLFGKHQALVLFMPVGSAVRLVAPLLVNKRSDPAVVVVDDAGRFAVSLVAGHAGGANRLAQVVAGALGAIPVVTTGSDALGTPTAETLGAGFGWRVEAKPADLTRLSAAFVNGETVGWYQLIGEELPESWAPNVVRLKSLLETDQSSFAAGVVVTDRLLLPLPAGWVVYRPDALTLGIGTSRGVSADEIVDLVQSTLMEEALSLAAARVIYTVDLKRNETGLTEAAARLGLRLHYFSTDELAAAPNVPTPSEVVRRHIGVVGVAEPAAILGSDFGELIVAKRRGMMATLAIARRRSSFGQSALTGPLAGSLPGGLE